jgi:hypothetical protein
VDGGFLGRPTPFLAMRILGIATNVRVTVAEQEAAGVANPRPDQAQIARGVEEARIPPPPPGQQLLNLIPQRHVESTLRVT